MRGIVLGLGTLAVAACFSNSIEAATATANLPVSATVINNCTISTAAVAFGNYDPVGVHDAANLDGTGTVTVACTKGSTATVGLGLGGNPAGATRRMSDGSGNFLTYEMYQDAGRVNLWGNAAPDLLAPGAAPSKAARNFTVFGRVASGQDVPAGAYTDTVVATVNF